MTLTSFTEKVNTITDTNADAKLHTELKKFFADANNRRLMRADSGKDLSQDHAKKVATELKNLDEKKQALLKNGVSDAMKNLTAKINGEIVSCADILANNWERAKNQNIPELKQAAALVSLHYMITNDKALLYGAEAQEYAKQFCDDELLEVKTSDNRKPGIPILETIVDYDNKEEVKEEVKEKIKEEVKEEVKEKIKEEVKEEEVKNKKEKNKEEEKKEKNKEEEKKEEKKITIEQFNQEFQNIRNSIKTKGI